MRQTSEIAKGTQIQWYRLFEVIHLLEREKANVKGRENIQLVFLSASFGNFGCFAAQLVIFLLFIPGFQQYLWRGLTHTVILTILTFFLTILFRENFFRDDLVLEFELFSCSTSQVSLYQTSFKKEFFLFMSCGLGPNRYYLFYKYPIL